MKSGIQIIKETKIVDEEIIFSNCGNEYSPFLNYRDIKICKGFQCIIGE